MGIRAGCLILGAFLAGTDVPLLWLWLSMCAVAMVLLPWLAVLIANDRPAKRTPRPRPAAGAGADPRVLDAKRSGPVIEPDR
ncbi:hypothetical protein GCM10010123_04600 [Pilimelia anulata]|uniref:DUF3099 domain-containing protein n=2 Tax=Pilimelia anulata TaxID=53371 RepID=A0A8J3B2Z8_9ACTN|nr:hypothetical protein GCM10010123_04600 [Pilimelia anulata]